MTLGKRARLPLKSAELRVDHTFGKDAMPTTILIICGLMFVVSCYCVAVSLADAPEGYEDETGFSFGPERSGKRGGVSVPAAPVVHTFEPAGELHQSPV